MSIVKSDYYCPSKINKSSMIVCGELLTYRVLLVFLVVYINQLLLQSINFSILFSQQRLEFYHFLTLITG